MNINTSSYWSASSATSNGLSGLVSGMDTESMVEKLLSGTQSKIDAAKGEQQITKWKQEMYREVITAINDFKNKYFNSSFDASSANNFASSGFFNSMKAALVSGSGLKVVSADSSALTGEMKVKIEQLASAAKITTDTSWKISGNSVTGSEIDLDKLKESLENTVTLSIKKGGQTEEVKVDLYGATTQDQILEKLNTALKDKGFTDITAKTGAVGTTVSFEIAKDSGVSIESISASEIGGALTGLTGYSTSTDEDGNTIVNAGAEMELNAFLSFDVNFDGINKTIVLDNISDVENLTLTKLSDAINEKLGKAFGTTANGAVIQTAVSGDGLQFKFADGYDTKGHSFRLTGVDLNELGITPGSSSHVSSSTKLGDLAGNSGSVYEFTINGESFKFTSDQTVGEMMSAINASGAGVKISYSSLADQFVLESGSTGANYNISMSQQTGNVLGAMFGNNIVDAGGSAQTDRLLTGTIAGTAMADDVEIEEASIQFTVNGELCVFSLPRKTGENAVPYTKQEFEEKFNEYLDKKFGAGAIHYDAATGSMSVSEGYEVEITAQDVVGTDSGTLGLAANNFATGDTALNDIINLSDEDKAKLAGQGITKLSDLEGKGIGVTFNADDGRLTVTDPSMQLSGMTLGNGKEFATNASDLTNEQKACVTAGVDAKVNINGVDTTRSSNTFTIDGITMELTGVTGDEPAVIGTERDVDTIVEAFENFVKDYNAMLDKLYGYTDQEAEYRDYPPLTSAQKEEMTENEIKLWEEKAKTGLLRNDDSITNFLSQMRTAMYERPAGCALALYDIGIETGEYTQKGKLNIDTAQLRNALTSDPASVEQLFLDMEEGLAGKLEDAMKAAANPSSGSPGVLVELAGIKGYASEKNNSLTQELTELKERIEELQAKYDKEKQRYWDQFNTMEQILANFNSQSAMISSQFSGY